MMSMAWLALFSFCVVEVCDIIAYEFDISVTILGFTVAAIGTSFPNVKLAPKKASIASQTRTLARPRSPGGHGLEGGFVK